MKKASIAFFMLLGVQNISAFSDKEDMKLQSFYRNKKVLVTGGCGFIGSEVARELVRLGAQVTILDNLASGSPQNIAPIKDKITFIKKSITDAETCLEVVKGHEIIFHLAAFVSVPKSVEEPLVCHEININGTMNMLEAARVHNVKRLVFSSSCSIYGEFDGICTEETPENATSPYAASKLIGELICKQYSINFNVPCVILRYFNVYGPKQNPHAPYAAVMAKFTYQMERNLPVTIFGDGTQTRDYVPVQDVARANLMVGMLPQEKVDRKVINVGTGKSVSVLDLIDVLKGKFPNYTGAVQFAEPRLGDVKHVRSSCDRLNQLVSEFSR